jgi:hypothetical protein
MRTTDQPMLTEPLYAVTCACSVWHDTEEKAWQKWKILQGVDHGKINGL